MTMRTSFVGVRDLYEGSFLSRIFMSERKPELTACHECDLLLREPAIEQIQGASTCPRCAAVLSRADRDSLDKSLALACAALVLLLLANLFPIVGLNIQGQNVEATVFGAARPRQSSCHYLSLEPWSGYCCRSAWVVDRRVLFTYSSSCAWCIRGPWSRSSCSAYWLRS
jgi:hypothetical protein